MKLFKYLLSVVLLLSFQNMEAQIFTNVIDETALQFRVKQIDEFFVRFNYETDYKGEKPKLPYSREEHKKNLLTLLNIEKFTNANHQLDSIASKFVDHIIDDSIQIHYEDTTWFSEARGSLVYNGKIRDVTVILKTERIKDVMYKWVVKDIQSSLFSPFPKEPKDSITISPAEHGIGFMTIPETFNLNKASVGTSFAKGYQRHNLIIFDFLMATGKIKMNAITKVIFHFQLKDFDFDVERIEKDTGYNQGWLINKIRKKI